MTRLNLIDRKRAMKRSRLYQDRSIDRSIDRKAILYGTFPWVRLLTIARHICRICRIWWMETALLSKSELNAGARWTRCRAIVPHVAFIIAIESKVRQDDDDDDEEVGDLEWITIQSRTRYVHGDNTIIFIIQYFRFFYYGTYYQRDTGHQ